MKIVKSYKDIQEEDIFLKSDDGNSLYIGDKLNGMVADAKKVCLVLEGGLTDTLAKMLASSNARKYLIVSAIDEAKYEKLKDNIVAREVDHIKGNYAIIDDKAVFFFDKELNGYAVWSTDAIKVVQHLFLKEFWEHGREEFIDRKRPCAEVTFDIPPLYGNSEVLIDESFESETPVAKLIKSARLIASAGKANGITCPKGEIFIKDASRNTDFLNKSSTENIFLAPNLPCSLVYEGSHAYLLNFDIAEYMGNSLLEKGKGRLFAVRCSDVVLGKIYRFYKHKTRGDLSGKEVLASNGKPLDIVAEATENRVITEDLRMAYEYEKMDGETREARLEKNYPNIFKTDKCAVSVTYDIAVEIVKRKMNGSAEIYGMFEKARDGLRKKWSEILSAAKQLKLEKKIEKYEINAGGISTREAYINAVAAVNEAVKLINNHGDEDVDEALSEVTAKKKKVSVQPITALTLKMDIPVNGKLYQNKDKYEYVLTSAEKLSSAMQEMKAAGIENTNVLYITE